MIFHLRQQSQVVLGNQDLLCNLLMIIEVSFLHPQPARKARHPVAGRLPPAGIKVEHIKRLRRHIGKLLWRETLNRRDAQRPPHIAQQRLGEFVCGRPCRQNSRLARLCFQNTRGLLVQPDEVRVREVVLKWKGVGRVDEPRPHKAGCGRRQNKPGQEARQSHDQGRRDEIEQGQDRKEIPWQNCAAHQA